LAKRPSRGPGRQPRRDPSEAFFLEAQRAVHARAQRRAGGVGPRDAAVMGPGNRFASWMINAFRGVPPGSRTIGALGAGVLGYELLSDPVERFLRSDLNLFGDFERAVEGQMGLRRSARHDRLRTQRLARQQQMNTMMLARTDPQLFNEIMAGRQLPQEGLIIGGSPRTDLLRRVVDEMSLGGFGQAMGDEMGMRPDAF
jgi:hypothetical protein